MKEQLMKITNFIERHNNTFVVMLIFLSIFGITLNVNLESSDELWNFQNIYKMYNGFQIYKDANVIITPLFFWIGEIIFKILGANFLSFRIYNMIIMTFLFFTTYLILKELKISKKTSLIIVLTLIVLKRYYIILGEANYNMLALSFFILGIYFYLKNYKYNNIIQGIIIFLIFSTKQNIGVFYILGLLIYEIFLKKEKIKNIFIKFFIFIFLLIIMLFKFYLDNNLLYFINYAFLGISEFATQNIFIDISNSILTLFFIIINLSLFIVFIKNKKINSEEKNRLTILECFSIPLIFVMVPIQNEAHFLIGIYLSIIEFIYLIKIFFRELGIKINNKIIKCVLITFLLFTCTYSIFNFVQWQGLIKLDEYKFTEEEPFYGSLYRDELMKNINNVKQYIEKKERNVIVLSHKAALYMVPLKRNNGIFDLPFKGNFGKEGEEGLINKIKKLKDTEILIEKDEDNITYQESKLVREYIINNMDKIGEIEEFDIYYSN